MDNKTVQSFDALDQNNFKFGKLNYASRECPLDVENVCELCSFHGDNHKCFNSPPCSGLDRDDNRDVYYIAVY